MGYRLTSKRKKLKSVVFLDEGSMSQAATDVFIPRASTASHILGGAMYADLSAMLKTGAGGRPRRARIFWRPFSRFRRLTALCATLLLTLIAIGVPAMSQNNLPNLTNPTTVDDYKALAEFLQAQVAAAQAQTQLITAQQALAKAKAPDTQLDAATAAASLAAQQKALSDAQAAILKNKFSVPDSGYTGEVKVGDKAGQMEGALLSSVAVRTAATGIAKNVAMKSNAPKLVLYAGSDLPDFQALIAFETQATGLEKALDDAQAQMDGPKQAAVELLHLVQTEFVATPALIGAGLDAVNKLLGFFRTDYSVQGIAVSSDDVQLIDALAGALTEYGKQVFLPALYNPNPLMGTSGIVTRMNSLSQKRVQLQQAIDVSSGLVDKLNTVAALPATAPDVKKKMIDAAANLKTAVDRAKSAATLYDGAVGKLTTPDDKGKLPLALVIQQDAVRTMLKNGADLMTAKVSSTGGSYYTKKNLWTFFGGMPFFVMGGVVVDYAVFKGSTGEVVIAGGVPIDGGFHKIGNLPRELGSVPPLTNQSGAANTNPR
jgi:hypothetical protein